MRLSPEQLTGRVDTHVEYNACGCALQPGCWRALANLQAAAAADGFDLQIASAFRSFERQLAIWNSKARCERPVHDDSGAMIDMGQLNEPDRLRAILRFSALPGASRHHWGTDLDVFDAAAMPAGYQLQLNPAEVAHDGIFSALHHWLDARIDAGHAFGFYRPYALDRGGVAPERWHLSYAPLAQDYVGELTVAVLSAALGDCDLELRGSVHSQLPELHRRYVCLS